MDFENEKVQKMISKRRPIHSPEPSTSVTSIRDESATRISQDTTEELSDSLTKEFPSEDELSEDSFEYAYRTSSNLSNTGCTPDRNFLNRSKSVPKTPIRPARKHETKTNTPEVERVSPIEPKVNWMNISLLVLLLICVTAAVSSKFYKTTEISSKFNCSYEDLKRIYPEQNEYLWKSLKIGTENILNKVTRSPGIYLLLHHGGRYVQNLIREISLKTSSCFGNSWKLIEMSPEDFKSANVIEDYGIIINKYRSQLKGGKVALIVNLNEIPAQAARALHSICDTITPIAEDVIVFLTLKIPKDLGSSHSDAYNYLFELWEPNLERYELDPLITRVTDHTIFLTSQ